ncbi:MAG: prolyl oligopeptidase family serine peptidase [Bacteroidales bacterium]|nr:prolyl oligopeptidase family serine peptidase [Bacteroidales bacterium]MDD2426366.1 prolyl oligopeptidase family serine peptidase [Bacteroidales bacterium]MDD3990320.1 prolyl oligopeptidase family serine peptidase [Bacteroidales bacterium]
MENRELSQKGSWLSYCLYYTGSDTLIIQQTYGNKKYMIAKAGGMKFLGDSLVSFNQNDKSYLMSLNSGRKEAFSSGTGFLVSNNEQYLMVFHKPSEKLVLRSLQDNDSLVLTGISEYFYNPAFEGVCTFSSGKIDIIRLEKGFHVKSIPVPQNRKILELKWHPNGNLLAYTMGPAQNSRDTTDVGLVGYYDLNKERNWYLNPAETEGFPRGHILILNWNYPLEFSPDGKHIFFAHKPEIIAKDKEIPEVWKSDDYYMRKSISAWSNDNPRISMWNPANNKYLLVTDQNFPEAFYGLNKDYTLVYNPAKYKYRLYKFHNTFDVYLMNLESGERKLLITKFTNSVGSLNISPSGRYVLYLKDKQWWCYDTQKDLLYNLTEKLETVSGMKRGEKPLESVPEGWTQDERAIYMHDQYDLWEITIDATPSERITLRRENGECFKLINNILGAPSDQRNNRGIYLDDSILFFDVRKGDTMGYAYKNADGRIVYINMDECYIEWPKIALKIALNNKTLSFIKENYDIPPRLMVYNVDSDTLFQAFQSNPHYKEYQWHERKRITYHNKNGKELSGILYYPIGYQKDSLYPMVVHVYEKQSQYWHQYINPSFYNASTGYNPINLTSDGYFVFLPDIEYEIGEPGFSAADCIISGTKAAMENAQVNPAKIGLIGQSFGGYETMFTITQTDLFATAIAGAGVSDFTSDYFNIEGISWRFFQYEDYQLRMGKSLFEDYQGYLDNSPQYHAQNIHIPFLLYTGGKDYHVHYTQTMAFHFAMTRLGKENTMLIYPDEAHAFQYPENKKDLTIKVHQWFGHYLKGGAKQDWMP